MGRYDEELVKAGVMLAGEGLQSSAKGKRVRLDGSKRIDRRPVWRTKELGADDFGAEFTPELRAQEGRIRAQAAGNRA